jgi:hypothetical protein
MYVFADYLRFWLWNIVDFNVRMIKMYCVTIYAVKLW